MTRLALAVVFCVPMGALAQDKVSVLETQFFPLKVGQVWHYRAGNNNKVQVRVAKLEFVTIKKGGKDEKVPCFRLESSSGQRQLTELVGVLGDGVYRFSAADKEIHPPVQFFKLPLEKGQSWDCESTSDGDILKGTFTAGEDTVKVPAGEFRTITVSCPDFQIGNRIMSLKYWFALDVGIVKQHVKIGDNETTLELEKLEMPK